MTKIGLSCFTSSAASLSLLNSGKYNSNCLICFFDVSSGGYQPVKALVK